jgi:hypothetical protein
MEVGTASIKFADQYSVVQAGMSALTDAIALLSEKAQRRDLSRAERRAITSQINVIKLKLARTQARMNVLRASAEKAGVNFDVLDT